MEVYRGNRNYIHSTSLCNYFFERYENIIDFEITLRDWILKVPSISIDPGDHDKGFVKLVTSDQSMPTKYYIYESNVEVISREPFEEELMDEKFFNDSSKSKWCLLESNHTEPFTFFDRSICGGKHLLEYIFHPQKKLILSKLSVKLPLEHLKSSKTFIKVESHLGDKLYKLSVLDQNFVKLGELIYFGK